MKQEYLLRYYFLECLVETSKQNNVKENKYLKKKIILLVRKDKISIYYFSQKMYLLLIILFTIILYAHIDVLMGFAFINNYVPHFSVMKYVRPTAWSNCELLRNILYSLNVSPTFIKYCILFM